MVRVHLSPLWGYSSVGRAPALQAGGHEFESRYLHENIGRAVWFLKTFMKNLFFDEVMDKQEDIRRMSVMK